MWKKKWEIGNFLGTQNWVFSSCRKGAFLHLCTCPEIVRYVRFQPWPCHSDCVHVDPETGSKRCKHLYTAQVIFHNGSVQLSWMHFFCCIFCTLLYFLRIVLFTTRRECHERNCHLRKKITIKGQEQIFSGGYKPPSTSVSENLLKLSNSSFSYSDSETART